MANSDLFNDPNRYIKDKDYSEGLVCCIDILGFGKYSEDTNYETIRDFFNENINLSINIMSNLEYKICILSDTIFITLNKKDFKYLDSQLSSLVSFCRMFRQKSLDKLGLEIRAGITYGKYMQSGTSNFIIFGPAVVRSHQLAEHLDTIDEIPTSIKQNRPATIVIDKNVFQVDPGNIILNNYMRDNVLLKSGYVLINPFDDSPLYKFTLKELAAKYLEFLHSKIIADHRQKYMISEKFALLILSGFDGNKKIKYFGKEICTTINDMVTLYKSVKWVLYKLVLYNFSENLRDF